MKKSFKSNRNSFSVLFSLLLVLMICSSVYAQNAVSTKESGEITSASISVPTAVPVLSPEEAQKINEKAIKEHESRLAQVKRNQLFSSVVKCLKFILAGALAFAYLLVMSRLTSSTERKPSH